MSHPVAAVPYGAFCLEASACFWMCKVKPCLSPHPMGGLLKMQLILKEVLWGLGSICARALWATVFLHSVSELLVFHFTRYFHLCTTPDWHLYINIYGLVVLLLSKTAFYNHVLPEPGTLTDDCIKKSLNLNLIFRSD